MFIRDCFIKILKLGVENLFYSVIVDEVMDFLNKEIFFFCLRFVLFELILVIKEIFFDFFYFEGINGEKIVEIFLKLF